MNGTEKGTWLFLAIISGSAAAKFIVDVETWWIGLVLVVVSGCFVFLREWRKKANTTEEQA